MIFEFEDPSDGFAIITYYVGVGSFDFSWHMNAIPEGS
jgi:hypothetical protein